MASINNLTAVYADKFCLASSTGVSEISDTYATKTEVENLNFATHNGKHRRHSSFKYKTATKFQ